MDDFSQKLKEFEGGQLEIRETKRNKISVFRLGIGKIIFLSGGIQVVFSWQAREENNKWRKSYRFIPPNLLIERKTSKLYQEGDKTVIEVLNKKYILLLASAQNCLSQDIINQL